MSQKRLQDLRAHRMFRHPKMSHLWRNLLRIWNSASTRPKNFFQSLLKSCLARNPRIKFSTITNMEFWERIRLITWQTCLETYRSCNLVLILHLTSWKRRTIRRFGKRQSQMTDKRPQSRLWPPARSIYHQTAQRLTNLRTCRKRLRETRSGNSWTGSWVKWQILAKTRPRTFWTMKNSVSFSIQISTS